LTRSGSPLYENQDPEQAEMNLRGKFTTDGDGRFWFRSVMMDQHLEARLEDQGVQVGRAHRVAALRGEQPADHPVTRIPSRPR
jgi:hypothetical protein